MRTYNECRVLELLSHDNIVGLIDWVETKRHVYIITELAEDGAYFPLYCCSSGVNRPSQCISTSFRCGPQLTPRHSGDLLEYIRLFGPLSEKQLCNVFVSLVDALRYAHSHGFAHLDLKVRLSMIACLVSAVFVHCRCLCNCLPD